jgi:phenylpropionate dioxygenase-like ring-hydroxylating dioxygenase large terminal subunit
VADGATATRKSKSNGNGSAKPKRQPPYGLIEGNYFQCWYPMALLKDLTPGKIIGRDFCGSRVVIYRAKNGKCVVQSAWCPHFGADLSLGEIHQGEIRCPYHHWRFDETGHCSHIPTGDKIPNDCGIANYPVAEAWGLLWAFNGEKPLYDVPGVPGITEEESIFLANERGERNVDHVFSISNSFDFQHLMTLHGFPPGAVPEEIKVGPYTMDYDRKGPMGLNQSRVTGVNTFSTRGQMGGGMEQFMLVSSASVRPHTCHSFYVLGVRKPAPGDDTPAKRQEIERVLQEGVERAKKLYREDEPILETMRFRGIGKARLVAADKHMGTYFRYVAKFPQAPPLDA